MEPLWGLSQVVLGIAGVGDRTAGGVGVGYVWMRLCARVHVIAAEPAVFGVFVQIVADYPPTPGKYQCLCVSCQASGPLCPQEQPAGQFVGAQPQQAHPQLWTAGFKWGTAAQLSPLVFSFLSALSGQDESVVEMFTEG